VVIDGLLKFGQQAGVIASPDEVLAAYGAVIFSWDDVLVALET
jgi:hypothetical protein